MDHCTDLSGIWLVHRADDTGDESVPPVFVRQDPHSMVLTLVAMLLILFLAILLLSLFQQVYVFIYQIYTEIAYRIRG
jgi:hypothetical protein